MHKSREKNLKTSFIRIGGSFCSESCRQRILASNTKTQHRSHNSQININIPNNQTQKILQLFQKKYVRMCAKYNEYINRTQTGCLEMQKHWKVPSTLWLLMWWWTFSFSRFDHPLFQRITDPLLHLSTFLGCMFCSVNESWLNKMWREEIDTFRVSLFRSQCGDEVPIKTAVASTLSATTLSPTWLLIITITIPSV
jgi:hypothetical protein